MSATKTTQYIREVLHHSDPPPPTKARFFYTSAVPIDDPLSPLPPPMNSSGSNVPLKQPPKPFSEYDNAALEDTWHDLRRQLTSWNERKGEKSASKESSRVRKRRSASLLRDNGSGQSTKPSTPRARPAKASFAPSPGRFSDLADVSEALEQLDGPSHAEEATPLPETTGTPFIRAPSRRKLEPGQMRHSEDRRARPKIKTHDTYEWDDPSHLVEHSPAPKKDAEIEDKGPQAKVAVGASRLHQVEMPDLQMTPIYWTPIGDIAQVVRATWFYQDTMLPVEVNVANMLEAGYIDLKVWSETWKDELNSAVEVGAEGEMKIVHKLWPEIKLKASDTRPPSRTSLANREESLLRAATASLLGDSVDTSQQQREKAVEAACDIIDNSTGSEGHDNKAFGTLYYGRQGQTKTYATAGVIYVDEKRACILTPALLPSAYYGRRPLANYIRKGHQIGISVVRGFDQAAWDKLHPPKDGAKKAKVNRGVTMSASGVSPKDRAAVDPEVAKSDRPQVSDLVLVIHGIGQKLSQRMESWHFNHAINAFRREIMVEAGSKEVSSQFRKDMGGIMALPINWRHSLSFEEGGYRPDGGSGDEVDPFANDFTLTDITPDTLPSVRNIVSDVMLDIPYYMSHHQPKMIAAVIREANRVYKLWCHNNPGFSEHGRVHIIAHSLGSVMSIDILSQQPTIVPDELSDPTKIDLDAAKLDHLIFNTHNLFLAGSPAGFFVLLRKAQLRPRIDHPSAEALADPTTNIAAICGERGQYGCIAVHNVYNIINGYDPVAYQMNAAVDAAYAASLKKFFIPNSAPSFWFAARSGGRTGWFSGQPSATAQARKNANTAPNLARLPSTVEMDTHNFSREEIAEKRMTLLNDNGQIDYFLKYGGGAFEIQYLTMLGAHSAYWGLKDFVRMVVMEVGRPEGKEGALMGLRALKRKALPIKEIAA